MHTLFRSSDGYDITQKVFAIQSESVYESNFVGGYVGHVPDTWFQFVWDIHPAGTVIQIDRGHSPFTHLNEYMKIPSSVVFINTPICACPVHGFYLYFSFTCQS